MGEKLGSPAFCVRDGSCDLLSKRFAVPLFNDAKDSALVRITLARRRRRISTHSMAERLQVSTATLRRLERGDPSLSVGSDRNGCRIQRLWSLRCFRAFRLSFFRHVVIVVVVFRLMQLRAVLPRVHQTMPRRFQVRIPRYRDTQQAAIGSEYA